jgi:DNA-binding NtrC family response regulator
MSTRQDDQHDGRGLAGARILVVEDEYYLAEDLCHALEAAGAEVVGPVGSLGQAEGPLLAGGLDGAVLDMNLRGEHAFALAERLQAADVPFVIVSGYSAEALPDALGAVPRLEKPVDARRAVEALVAAIARRTH